MPPNPNAGPDAEIGSTSSPSEAGVKGINESRVAGAGVVGLGPTGVEGDGFSIGVRGHGSIGVRGDHNGASTGTSTDAMGFLAGFDPQFHEPVGVYGESEQQGVMGLTLASNGTGVYGGGTTAAGGHQIGVRGETVTGVGVQGRSFGPGPAGKFIGNVEVTGKMTAHVILADAVEVIGNLTAHDVSLTGGDCAEDFDTSGTEENEPGTVMVIDDEGALMPAHQAYDKRVAGVISGGGDLKPGIVLDKRTSQRNRCPIALLGKIYCKVDAQYSGIDVGDLLTTSPTLGHAMKVSDPLRAFGSVIGKALRPLKEGQGMIPILIALQ
jgi:hypothetical protein